MRVAIVFLVASGLFGQEFEAASVKPSTPQERDISMFTYPGGRITVRNYTLKQLIQVAWEVQDFQITGGPGWIGQDRFSMELKPPPSSESSKFSPANPKNPPPKEEITMLQNLLADRFQLKLHRDSREGTIYVLVVSGKAQKLEPPKDPNDRPLVMLGFNDGSGPRSYYLQGINATMKLLAARLAGFLRRPVDEQTGIQGNFDFKFSYEQDETNSALISAVRQIGLKLDARKGPMEILVIDRAEKPSAN
jgi:uncharacterized protein (TIGR03435 family)